MPADVDSLDVVFTLRSGLYNNGVAFAVKFPNVEEACPRTVRDFDTMIKVPRLYDVAVVKASVVRTKRKMVTVSKAGEYFTVDYGSSSQFRHTGTEITKGIATTIPQEFGMDVNIGKDYLMVVCQKDVYPAFLKALRGYVGYTTNTGVMALNRHGWYSACQDVQTIV
ncbi:MAG: hypothetical protein AB2693_13575 [Candidatus Thiodiazotropha sp.]